MFKVRGWENLMVSSLFANLISQGGIHHFEDACAWTSKSAFSIFYPSKLNWKVLMKCMLQDMRLSQICYSAVLTWLNIAWANMCVTDPTDPNPPTSQGKKKIAVALGLTLFFPALLLILEQFLHNTDWILMNASLCLVAITFPLKFPLILIIQMPFCQCLDPRLHLFVPLSTPKQYDSVSLRSVLSLFSSVAKATNLIEFLGF